MENEICKKCSTEGRLEETGDLGCITGLVSGNNLQETMVFAAKTRGASCKISQPPSNVELLGKQGHSTRRQGAKKGTTQQQFHIDFHG